MADQPLNIAEAQELIASHCSLLAAETTAVDDALAMVLAEQVIASGDVPSRANSAMDGFAARSGEAGRTLRVIGESRAGHPTDVTVGDGEAVRISTGATMPDGADAVAPIEVVDDEGADEADALLDELDGGSEPDPEAGEP